MSEVRNNPLFDNMSDSQKTLLKVRADASVEMKTEEWTKEDQDTLLALKRKKYRLDQVYRTQILNRNRKSGKKLYEEKKRRKMVSMPTEHSEPSNGSSDENSQ